jgi:hypothetical protein
MHTNLSLLIGVLKRIFVSFAVEEVCSVYGYDLASVRIWLSWLISFASISINDECSLFRYILK